MSDEPALDARIRKDRDSLRKYQSERDIADLKAVLTTVEGRRHTWKLLSAAGIFQGGFVNNGSEQYYRAGRRDIGLELLARIMADFPDLFQLMQAEAITLAVNERPEKSYAKSE